VPLLPAQGNNLKQGDDFYLDFVSDLKTGVQTRLKMFALNAEVVFSEVDNQENSTEEAQVTLASSEKFIPQDSPPLMLAISI
jgi:folate-binding Fe-S cluster repair protein YgfZ